MSIFKAAGSVHRGTKNFYCNIGEGHRRGALRRWGRRSYERRLNCYSATNDSEVWLHFWGHKLQAVQKILQDGHYWIQPCYSQRRGRCYRFLGTRWWSFICNIFWHFIWEKFPPGVTLVKISVRDIVFSFEALAVDFSDAQRNGLVTALTLLAKKAGCQLNDEEIKNKTLLLSLKGCDFHFQQSLRKVAHSGALSNNAYKSVFSTHMNAWLNCSTMKEFDDRKAQLKTYFPSVRGWINWWALHVHAVLIFPSVRGQTQWNRTFASTTLSSSQLSWILGGWQNVRRSCTKMFWPVRQSVCGS